MRFEKAKLQDIPEMLALVEPEVKKGNILPRSGDEIATAIRSYVLAKSGAELVGFCALHIYSPTLAEVRSLIVKEGYQGRGIGGRLVELVLDEGRELGVKEALVLTYRENLFKRLGFVCIQKEQIPDHKIWADCIKCKHFPKCDEIALQKRI